MQKGRLKRFQTAFFLLLALKVIITACVDAGVAVAVCFGQIFNAVAAALRLIFAYAAITAQSIHGGTVCQIMPITQSLFLIIGRFIVSV